MLALAKSFNPPPSDWSTTTSTDFCKWSGVRCTGGRVNIISLADKSLSGFIAPEISTLSELKSVYLRRNRLTGKIPSLAKLSSLQEIYMDENSFIGVETAAFAGLTSLRILCLSDNANFSAWSFPSELADSISLTSIYLDNTNIFGALPNIFQSLASLQNLRLSFNHINGPLPPLLLSLGSLKSISLDNNKFQGPLPLFPPEVKVIIDHNGFCTNKAGQNCSPQVMTLLAVAGGLGYPLMLSESWQGDDACSGWAYVTCDSSGKNVVALNLGKRGFSGFISLDIASLISLKSIYLNDNNLSGFIPKQLAFMTSLQLIDVSNNNLSGEIPKFPASVKFIYKPGNSLLGTNAGDSSMLSGSVSSGGSSDGGGGSKGLVIVTVFALLGFLLILSILGYVVSRLRNYRETRRTNPTSCENLGQRNFIFQIDVLIMATKNFSEELGRGGFGIVYAGELEDGTRIAVKKMRSSRMSEDIETEISLLTLVRHRNLVAFLGYCMSTDDILLVYEYMPQGDLEGHLFKWRQLGRTPLTWKQRVFIALDVARGLEYLHDLAAPQGFIHRDLKPANILLGDDMRAKIADFGSVKDAPDGTASVSAQPVGTHGYIAPEYLYAYRFTKKVDVYAFGVILIELLTGKKSVNYTVAFGEVNLVAWFKIIQINKENIPKALDQTLSKADKQTLKSIHRVAELAKDCTAKEHQHRPEMSEVVHVLAGLSCEKEDGSLGSSATTPMYPQVLKSWQKATLDPLYYSYSTHSSISPKPSGSP